MEIPNSPALSSALKIWLTDAKIKAGPLFRKINRGRRGSEKVRLSTDAVRQILKKRAEQAGLKGKWSEPLSPHSLRAGFVTTAYRNGVPDEEIMGHTRHRSLTNTMRSYVRRAKLQWRQVQRESWTLTPGLKCFRCASISTFATLI